MIRIKLDVDIEVERENISNDQSSVIGRIRWNSYK